MKLLVEKRPILFESVGSDNSDIEYLEGIFLQAETINGNGRWYPADLMERAVEKYKKDFMETNMAYGSLDHPDDPTMKLESVSHMFVSLDRDGNNWIGKIKLANTPKGLIAKEIVRMGASIGTSSRAVGDVEEGRGPHRSDLVTELEFITPGDLVATPSAPDAFLSSVNEGKEWILENGIWAEREMDRAKKALRKTGVKTKVQIKESRDLIMKQLFRSINDRLK